MDSRKLDGVQDWMERAKRCGYRVGQVARELRVSSRWLEIYFQKQFGESPHKLFAQWRLQEIGELVRSGAHGKKIAAEVGFASYGNLSRNIKTLASLTLGELRKTTSQNEKTYSSNQTCLSL